MALFWQMSRKLILFTAIKAQVQEYRSDCSVRTKSALFVHCCLCSIYLMKIGFEKIMGYPCSSLATKWKLQCIRPTTNTKRFRKFCVRLTHLGTNFAPISHQILHLKIKCSEVYLIRPPSTSLPTAAIAAIQNIKMACQLKWTNRVNPGRTEQPLRCKRYKNESGLFRHHHQKK